MCGIAGIACKTGAIPAAVIQAMTKMLRHRGPDDEGYVWLRTLEAPAEIAGGPETPAAVWHSPSAFAPEKTIEEAKNSAAQVVLGHRRLAILDLTSSGHQPMCDPTARYWIVHNGEIYNFQEIRQRLRARDSQFVSDTDTEVVLYAYQAWGKECLDQFNGMWAFAILDRPQNELFLARDRFGVKPLYYVFNGRYFAFASEIKALAASGIFERRAEEAQLLHFLATGLTDHAEQTLFAGIRRLPAGHWLRLNLRRWELDIKPYYELPARLAPLVAPCAEEEEETARMLLALLADSVALRLTSDVPVGTCLSGGLDSSSLACLMHRLNSRAPRCPDYQRTFSAVYGSHQYDESHYIEQVVRSIRSNHFYTTVTRADFSRDLLRFVWHQEEPFDKLGVYAQWQVYKLVRESGVKVTLDGQGGDELFAGYEVYFSDYYQSLLSQRRYGDWLRELLGFACHHGPLEAKTFLPSWRRLLRRALYGAIPPSQRAP
jgi:asparagine synthase (glutamine-hydrolysing)